MPKLEWANREAAVWAATRAPFRLLEKDPTIPFAGRDNEDRLILGATRPRRENQDRRFHPTDFLQLIPIFSLARRRHPYSAMNSAKVAMEAT